MNWSIFLIIAAIIAAIYYLTNPIRSMAVLDTAPLVKMVRITNKMNQSNLGFAEIEFYDIRGIRVNLPGADQNVIWTPSSIGSRLTQPKNLNDGRRDGIYYGQPDRIFESKYESPPSLVAEFDRAFELGEIHFYTRQNMDLDMFLDIELYGPQGEFLYTKAAVIRQGENPKANNLTIISF